MERTTVLYRPVGPGELRLIAESDYTAFPARLPGQPIFYPVLNKEYALQIAPDSNAPNPKQGAGYVTMFAVKSDFLSAYEVHTVGSAIHHEYWIPAEDLSRFNANIAGKIRIVAEFLAK
jgi:hypothetical protein